jgi:hypothetical protein
MGPIFKSKAVQGSLKLEDGADVVPKTTSPPPEGGNYVLSRNFGILPNYTAQTHRRAEALNVA